MPTHLFLSQAEPSRTTLSATGDAPNTYFTEILTWRIIMLTVNIAVALADRRNNLPQHLGRSRVESSGWKSLCLATVGSKASASAKINKRDHLRQLVNRCYRQYGTIGINENRRSQWDIASPAELVKVHSGRYRPASPRRTGVTLHVWDDVVFY